MTKSGFFNVKMRPKHFPKHKVNFLAVILDINITKKILVKRKMTNSFVRQLSSCSNQGMQKSSELRCSSSP